MPHIELDLATRLRAELEAGGPKRTLRPGVPETLTDTIKYLPISVARARNALWTDDRTGRNAPHYERASIVWRLLLADATTALYLGDCPHCEVKDSISAEYTVRKGKLDFDVPPLAEFICPSCEDKMDAAFDAAAAKPKRPRSTTPQVLPHPCESCGGEIVSPRITTRFCESCRAERSRQHSKQWQKEQRAALAAGKQQGGLIPGEAEQGDNGDA